MTGLTGCATSFNHEPPHDVTSVGSKNSKTLTAPSISQYDVDGFTDGFRITYAQIGMGFDVGCNPFRNNSEIKNQCSPLPESVKLMAISHCKNKGKKSVFWGNTTNWIEMTVSKFSCEENDA